MYAKWYWRSSKLPIEELKLTNKSARNDTRKLQMIILIMKTNIQTRQLDWKFIISNLIKYWKDIEDTVK